MSILIASLGDHPAVVTGMVKKLEKEKNITFDKVIVLHTQGSGRLITLGYDLIKQILGDQVRAVPLDFADPITYEDSLSFLRTLAGTLDEFEDARVHLSLAGGRKNMSALLAVICQFYPNVVGLYHLIDLSNEPFPSIEQLVDMCEDDQRASMRRDTEKMKLVELPYQPFFEAVDLKRYFRQVERQGEGSVTVTAEVEQFFRAIFQPHYLQVSFTKTAWNQVLELAQEGGERATNFFTCFKQMGDITSLKARFDGTFTQGNRVFYFYKRPHTTERPFYYTTPNPVHLYSENTKRLPVNQAIICGLSKHINETDYDFSAKHWLAHGDFEAHKNLFELEQKEKILLVPLGESPMVATQTYTLLDKVAAVALIYPQRNGNIKNGAELVKEAFDECKIKCKTIPIDKLRDVASTEECKIYMVALLGAIEQLRAEYPGKEIVLSLSGGRKGMSALTLFAAQQANVKWVYHTLITDPALEKYVTEETKYDTLKKLTREEKRRRLFLEAYARDKFTLFAIPVIPFVNP